MKGHDQFMLRCLELAEGGRRAVYPNPMVGAVLAHSGAIIGEGWHQRYGGPHAEVAAIESVVDRKLLSTATLYVNLEPCSHLGKTPPCVDLIVDSKIPRVVIGARDPNPKVNGQGILRLQESGAQITLGTLAPECIELNRRFYTLQHYKRPYIILKWAQTADHFTARTDYSSKWISGEAARKLVHRYRAEETAVLVGFRTAQYDDPKLTVRHAEGPQPIRIAIDGELELPTTKALFDRSVPTIIVNAKADREDENLTYLKLNFGPRLINDLLTVLAERGITSLIVEGGSVTLSRFIQYDLWDEARVFESKERFRRGIAAPSMRLKPVATEMIEEDILRIYRNHWTGSLLSRYSFSQSHS